MKNFCIIFGIFAKLFTFFYSKTNAWSEIANQEIKNDLYNFVYYLQSYPANKKYIREFGQQTTILHLSNWVCYLIQIAYIYMKVLILWIFHKPQLVIRLTKKSYKYFQNNLVNTKICTKITHKRAELSVELSW